jgi:hypothetical protein
MLPVSPHNSVFKKYPYAIIISLAGGYPPAIIPAQVKLYTEITGRAHKADIADDNIIGKNTYCHQ